MPAPSRPQTPGREIQGQASLLVQCSVLCHAISSNNMPAFMKCTIAEKRRVSLAFSKDDEVVLEGTVKSY